MLPLNLVAFIAHIALFGKRDRVVGGQDQGFEWLRVISISHINTSHIKSPATIVRFRVTCDDWIVADMVECLFDATNPLPSGSAGLRNITNNAPRRTEEPSLSE